MAEANTIKVSDNEVIEDVAFPAEQANFDGISGGEISDVVVRNVTIYGNSAAGGDDAGDFNIGDFAGGAGCKWDGVDRTFSIKGALSASSIDVPDTTTANSFHMENDGDTFWGCNNANFIADNDNALAYVLKTGAAKFQKIEINGSEAGGYAYFISNTIDTQAKNILDAFTFGVSGAIQIGSYVNGVSGDIRISPSGIIGRNSAGVNTFSIDGTTGSAVFSGSVTGAIITGSKYQTNVAVNAGIKIFTEAPAATYGDTGAFYPTVSSEPNAPLNGAEWTSPTNAFLPDGIYTTADQTAGKKYTTWKGFTYLINGIPSGATITGITVKAYAKIDTGTPSLEISLTKNGGDVVGTSKTTQILTTSDQLVSAGGSDQLWGTTWDRADFTSSFGVIINGGAAAAIIYSIDYIQVIIHYSETFTNADAYFEFWNGEGQNTLMYIKENTKDLYIDKANLNIIGALTLDPSEIVTGYTDLELPTDYSSYSTEDAWTNPANALTDNTSYATADTTARYSVWKGFDLLSQPGGIPAGATITGIEVQVEAKIDGGSGTLALQLTKDGRTLVGNASQTDALTTSAVVYTEGGFDNFWGTTWTRADFGLNFGIAIWQDSIPTPTFSIDYIKIKVYYTQTTESPIASTLISTIDGVTSLGTPDNRFGSVYSREIRASDKVYVNDNPLSGWVLVAKGRINSTANLAYTISGLTGDTAKMYKIVTRWQGTARDIYVTFNNDSGSNYRISGHEYGEYTDGDKDTIYRSEDRTYIYSNALPGGQFANNASEMIVYAESGKRRLVKIDNISESETDASFLRFSGMAVWTNTADELTRIDLTVSGTGTIGEYYIYANIE